MDLKSLHKYTYREYQFFPSDGNRHEVVNGEHYMNPAPSTRHQTVSRHLQFQLYTQLELQQRGKVFNAPTDVELASHDVVQPDLVVILTANQRIITPKRIRGIPDLCVEIISESNPDYDRILKLEMYQRCGVPEYWIVDPQEQVVDVYVLADQKSYTHTRCAESVLRPTFISDVEIDLDKIWRD
ncbi:MAG: Uma2 family endonuclease [Pirellulaceae bacterium]|nr:Uma2 family endonuclease [Planctomycetales bacterium]